MLRLQILQAEHGDCMILEYGTPANPKYILIDGGPAKVYRTHLRKVLQGIQKAGGALERVLLSHVDEDHVKGLLDLFADLKRQRGRGQPETITIKALWHNTFSDALGPEVEEQLREVLNSSTRGLPSASDEAGRSIDQGDQLTQDAEKLGIGINPDFAPEWVITLDQAPPAIVFDNLTLHIVGPTQKNLEDLRQKWLEWLEQHRDILSSRGILDEQAAREVDESVPNLSSIMVLAEADGKTILFAGDGHGDDLLQGLGQAGWLSSQGTLHVDVLKLPHHGSARNVSPEFFRRLTASKYVISANGKNGNPDPPTLEWLVQAAKKEGRAIEIWITNQTDSTRKLVEKYPPGECGYRLVKMEPDEAHAMVLKLAEIGA